MRHLWSLVAQGSAVDYETGVLSIFNLIEELHLPGGPPNPGEPALAPIPLELISTWESERPGEACFYQLRLVNGAGRELLREAPRPVRMNGRPRGRTRYRFRGIPILGEGAYRFVISVAPGQEGPFEDVGEAPLDVDFAVGVIAPRFVPAQNA